MDSLENISESRLFYSPKFKKILKDIGTEDSLHLLDLEGENFDGDITLIDINDEGQLTYNTERNFQKNWPDLWDLYFNQKNPPRKNNRITDIAPEVFDDKNRGSIGIGRFFSKVYPQLGFRELNELINSIKSQAQGGKYQIKVVEGDEIIKWYQTKNCSGLPWNIGNSQGKSVGGTLGQSCMMNKSENFQGIFDLYTKNPDVCKLVIMLDEAGDLVARSILWKAWTWEEDESGSKKLKEVFLQDRVYYTQDWIGTNLVIWAKKKGYYYKGVSGDYIYKNNKLLMDKRFIVKVKKIYYKKFPYLDTFIYYNVKSGELSNFKPKSGFTLQSTSGNRMTFGNMASDVRNVGLNWIRRFNEYNQFIEESDQF